MEPDDPPRKNYGFKERAFKRDNAPASGAPPPPTAKELAILSGRGVPAKPASLAGPRRDDPNDVYAVLQGNRTVEKKTGGDAIEVREVKSRRKREFWILLVGGNLAIIGAVAYSHVNVTTVVFGLAGLIVFSLGLSWVMWQVMDRY